MSTTVHNLSCDIVRDQANTGALNSQEMERMARRRFQRGTVFLRGKREPVWVGRWREDIIDADGRLRRVQKKEVLGTRREFPTKKLALREIENRLAPVNSRSYRALRLSTFSEFARLWQQNALTQHKASTQLAINCQMKKWLVPYFGDIPMRELGGHHIQMFLQSCPLGPKSLRNFVLTLRMLWRSAKAWGYVMHEPFEGLVLPKPVRKQPFFFTMEEVQRILGAAVEPYRAFYWLAAETGMRAGELCGLRVEDIDLAAYSVQVRQSVWRGKVQSPKTGNAIRAFAISSHLQERLRALLAAWRPNEAHLLFASSKGTPWDANLLVKRKLHPLLASLGIRRCGLHAFRHSNGSLMDRLKAPLKTRQERLGHAPGSDITLVVYTHSVSEDDRLIASKLGEILRPNAPTFPLITAGNA